MLAFAGNTPARAAAANGVAIELPAADGRRDGSGVATTAVIAHVAAPPAAAQPDASAVSGGVRGIRGPSTLTATAATAATHDPVRRQGRPAGCRDGRAAAAAVASVVDAHGIRRADEHAEHAEHPATTGYGTPATDACSVQWDHDGTSAYGTAASARFFVVVEQPGPWGRDAARESHLDRELGAELDARTSRAGGRFMLVRRPGGHPAHDGPRQVLVAHAGARPEDAWLLTAEVDDVGDLLGLDWGALARGSRALVQASLLGSRSRGADPARVHQRSPRRVLRRAGAPARRACGAGCARPCVGGVPHRRPPVRAHRRAPPLGSDHRAPRRPRVGVGARCERDRTPAGRAARSAPRPWPVRRARAVAVRRVARPRGNGRDPTRGPVGRRAPRQIDGGWQVIVTHADGRRWRVRVTREPRRTHSPRVLRQEGHRGARAPGLDPRGLVLDRRQGPGDLVTTAWGPSASCRRATCRRCPAAVAGCARWCSGAAAPEVVLLLLARGVAAGPGFGSARLARAGLLLGPCGCCLRRRVGVLLLHPLLRLLELLAGLPSLRSLAQRRALLRDGDPLVVVLLPLVGALPRLGGVTERLVGQAQVDAHLAVVDPALGHLLERLLEPRPGQLEVPREDVGVADRRRATGTARRR